MIAIQNAQRNGLVKATSPQATNARIVAPRRNVASIKARPAQLPLRDVQRLGSTVAAKAAATSNGVAIDQMSFASRQKDINQHFPGAIGVDDFIARVEVALTGFGFTSDNSIAMTNLCRDECTVPMKDKIESVFGHSFTVHGLGAVLSCGTIGVAAGLSHSPVAEDGKEHYVFFSFPHIGIDSAGTVGAITRPGRAATSCACGALSACLGHLTTEGIEANCKVPGVHDPLNPEYTILKQRLARRAKYEHVNAPDLNLVSLTQLAERTISSDLEFLIEKVVDPAKANYAVVTGVQIHNWATELNGSQVPSFEFVQPTKCYVSANGQKTHIDLSRVPALSHRQLELIVAASSQARKGEDEINLAVSGGVLGINK